MKEAIDEDSTAGLEDAELSAAKKVLAEEQRKVAVRDSLAVAVEFL